MTIGTGGEDSATERVSCTPPAGEPTNSNTDYNLVYVSKLHYFSACPLAALRMKQASH